MTRLLAMLYALVAYGAFFLVFLWFVAFVGNLPPVMGIAAPTTVDAANTASSTGTAIFANLILIAIFGAHHSIAARIGFKDSLTRTLPKSVERSTYVLVASLILAALMYYWQSIPTVIWDVSGSMLGTVLWALFALGWFILFTSTWLLNHFELFGLQQAWHHGDPNGPPAMSMKTPLYYKLVRHPIYTGFFIALWAAPVMSVGHLILSAGLTVYILIGISYEEKDLVTHFGDQYRDYRTKVGSLLPGIGKKSA